MPAKYLKTWQKTVLLLQRETTWQCLRCTCTFSSITLALLFGDWMLFLASKFSVQKKRKWTKTIPPVQCAGWCFVNLEKLNPSSRQSTKPWRWGEIGKLIYSCHAKSLWTHEVHCFNLLLMNFWWGQEKLFAMENTFSRFTVAAELFIFSKFLYWLQSVGNLDSNKSSWIIKYTEH